MTASAIRSFARPEPAPVERSPLSPPEGWLSVALGLSLILCTVWSIHEARWVEGTGIILHIATAGYLLGWLLARSKLSSVVALALGLIIGLVVAFVVVGQLLPPLGRAAPSFVALVADTVRWAAHPAGTPPVVAAVRMLQDHAGEFAARVVAWTAVGAGGQVSADNTIFLLFISYVAWMQGLVGAWGLFRLHDALAMALPSGVALVTNAAYTGRAQTPFVIFIISLLLLAVTLNLAGLQRRWEHLSIDYPGGLLFDVTVSSFIVVLALAVLAFFGPRPADNPIAGLFWTHMGEQWSELESASNRLFSGVNNPQGAVAGGSRDRLVLSGAIHLSSRLVMQVEADEPLYYRGQIFDLWTGREWLSSDKVPLSQSERQPVPSEHYALRKRVKLGFDITQSRSDVIYAPDEVVSLSIPYKLLVRNNDPGTGDIVGLRARRPAIPSLRYAAESLVSTAGVEDLRNAPVDVPEAMRRYTQLPDVPPSVRTLAAQLTRGQRTNYDKAAAIERALRRLPYSQEVKAPPPDRDPVEYFLFDLRQGYCDYFATAMVILLRTQGIPARLATGYVSGKYDADTHRYVVAEEDAHSWPEVFFPTYGWIRFEPSGYRPEISRPQESTASATGAYGDCEYGDSMDCDDSDTLRDLPDILPGSRSAAPTILYQPASARSRGWLLLPLALVILGLAGGTLAVLGRRERAAGDVVRRVYRRMLFLGSLFGLSRRPAETPLEYARTLSSSLHQTLELDRGAVRLLRLRSWIGPPRGEAETIATSYVRAQYGQQEQQGVNELECDRVLADWRALRWKLPILLFRRHRW